MFGKGHWMIVVNEEKEVDLIAKEAAKYHLLCVHKIGVYGKERQHEVYLVGKFMDYRRYIKSSYPKKK